MESKEIRVGNLIKSGEHILNVSYHEIRYAQINPKNNYEPIPLTEEWLLNFGFTFDGHIYQPSNKIKELSGKDIGVKYNSYFFNNRLNKWMETQTRVSVEYVHQLQNLYFSLTGEELIYN